MRNPNCSGDRRKRIERVRRHGSLSKRARFALQNALKGLVHIAVPPEIAPWANTLFYGQCEPLEYDSPSTSYEKARFHRVFAGAPSSSAEVRSGAGGHEVRHIDCMQERSWIRNDAIEFTLPLPQHPRTENIHPLAF
jgi:hypothetical protein